MDWITPKFRQGIDKLNTSLGNEGSCVDAHGVRFYQNGVQTIGGWAKHAAAAYTGTARAAMAWRTLEATKCLGWGTTSKLYAEIGGTRVDITPNLLQTVLTDCFTSVSGSTTFTVKLVAHMLQVGDSFTLSNHQSTLGGRTLEGTFTVASVPTPDTFTFTFGSAATSTVSTPGGGNVDIVIPLPAHYDTWTLAAWGENLLANPSGYGLFEFQPETAYSELIFNGTFTGNANGWALGTGWTYSSNAVTAAAATASNLSQSVEGILEPGRTYILSVGVTRTAGSLSIQMNVGSSDTPTAYEVSFSGTDTANCFGLANQMAAGMAIQFQTTGALPTGVTAATTYYITHVGFSHADIQFSATPGGSDVTFTGAGTGTHTMSLNLPEEVVIDIGTISADISKTGTYVRTFVCPADPSDIVFSKSSTFAGTIDNVSLKLASTAYRVMTAPPRIDAIFVDPVGIVVALGTTDLDQGQYSATLYRCSDLGNNKAWVPDTSSMATEQILRGVGGRLMGGINTSEQNLVAGDEGVLSFQYQGVFGKAFNPVLIGTGCGWISRHAAAAVNGIVLWMSSASKFFIFGGAGIGSLGKPVPIACRIEKDVFDHLDSTETSVIHCGLDLQHQEAWFAYPDTRDTGSECSRMAVVAWTETDEGGAVPWTQHLIARAAWVQPGTFPNPIAFGTSGGSNYVYDHESGQTADGAAIGEYLETAPFDIGEGEFIMRLKRIIPDFLSTSGNINIYVKARMSPKGTERVLGPYSATQLAAFLDMRIQARQIALRFEGATSGAFWRMIAIRLDVAQTGAKR